MKRLNSISKAFCIAGSSLLLPLTLLTVVDVFLRYFFNSPIRGVTDLTEFIIVIIVFPSLSWCALSGSHVSVDIIVSHFPKRVQAVLDCITLSAGLLIMILITFESLKDAMHSTHIKSTLLNLPHYPFQLIMTIGFALLCISMIAIIIEKVGKIIKGDIA